MFALESENSCVSLQWSNLSAGESPCCTLLVHEESLGVRESSSIPLKVVLEMSSSELSDRLLTLTWEEVVLLF